MTSADMATDPHYHARDMHIEWDDLQVGRVKGTAPAPKFSRTPAKIWRGSVTTGHDNDLVYREVLGLTENDLANLRGRQVI